MREKQEKREDEEKKMINNNEEEDVENKKMSVDVEEIPWKIKKMTDFWFGKNLVSIYTPNLTKISKWVPQWVD